MNDQSWEARAVDEIIALEARVDEIIRKIEYYEYLQHENSTMANYDYWLEDAIEELQSELSDVQFAIERGYLL